MQDKGAEIFKGLFDSNKLALIAAGIFSTALLDSISLVEASSIGLPVLAFAILGKDGGARLIREVETVGFKIVGGAYNRIAKLVINKFGQDSIIAKIFELPSSLDKRVERVVNFLQIPMVPAFLEVFVKSSRTCVKMLMNTQKVIFLYLMQCLILSQEVMGLLRNYQIQD